MAENIIEAVSEYLGHSPIQKVDPNHQDVKDASQQSAHEKLLQAAIPAVLTAFSLFAKAENGAEKILAGNIITPQQLFANKQEAVVNSIVGYSGLPAIVVAQTMEKISQAAGVITVQAAGTEPDADKIRNYIAGQRHNILSRLPGALQLGKLLDNDSLDDRTNKMEGPLSNIAHAIEQALSGNELSK